MFVRAADIDDVRTNRDRRHAHAHTHNMARVTHAAPPSLEESMSLMEELCRLYSCDDDQTKIRELRATRAQVEHVMRQREDHMAQLLQGVSSLCA